MLQQKDISGYLTQAWKEDPFKAKWTIVAKSYSVIRDRVGKAKAPLNGFLKVVSPLIGLISPDDYLAMMGWSLTQYQGEKRLVRNFKPDMTDFDIHLCTTNLSVEDIVLHCRQIGFFSDEGKTGNIFFSC